VSELTEKIYIIFLSHFNREKKTSLESEAVKDAHGATIFPFFKMIIKKINIKVFLCIRIKFFGKINIAFCYTSIEKENFIGHYCVYDAPGAKIFPFLKINI